MGRICKEEGIDYLYHNHFHEFQQFDGKTVVHPRQVDVVNAAFTPTKKEIRYAQRVMEALEQGERDHTGVVVVDGSMVDKPMERRARTVLAQARAAGVLEEEGGGDDAQ